MLKPVKYSHLQKSYSMAIALISTSFWQLKKPEMNFQVRFHSNKPIITVKRFTRMATIRAEGTVGLSETFSRLKKQGKVSTYFFC